MACCLGDEHMSNLPAPNGSKVVFKDNRVYKVELWCTIREEGAAAFANVWDDMLHLGLVPTDQERSSSVSSEVGVRLSPSVFVLATPLLDDGDQSDYGQHDPKLVTMPPESNPTSGVHLRMPPSGHTAAGTKRVQCDQMPTPARCMVQAPAVDTGLQQLQQLQFQQQLHYLHRLHLSSSGLA